MYEQDAAVRVPLRLVETVSVVAVPDGALLVQGRKALRVRGSASWLHSVLGQLRAGTATETFNETGGRLVEELRAYGWLTTERKARGDDTPWARQLGYLTLFGSDAQAMQGRIVSARVGVIGVGGIGGLVAQHLVGAGVRQLWLVDHDVVALHNLNRQYLFGVDDIGEAKVSAAARALRHLAPDLSVEVVRRRVAAVADLAVLPCNLDLLVMAADTPSSIMDIAWAWAASVGVPIIGAAIGLDTGYWGPLLVPAHGHCWPCFEQRRELSLTPTERMLEAAESEPTPYSFGPSNAVIAGLLACDAVRFLATGTCSTFGRRGLVALTEGHMSFFEGCPCQCQGRSIMED